MHLTEAESVVEELMAQPPEKMREMLLVFVKESLALAEMVRELGSSAGLESLTTPTSANT